MIRGRCEAFAAANALSTECCSVRCPQRILTWADRELRWGQRTLQCLIEVLDQIVSVFQTDG